MSLVLALHLRAGAPVFGEGASRPRRDVDIFRAGRPMQMGARDPGVGWRRARGNAIVTSKHQRWTQTNINDLRSGIASGVEIEVIADALGRTVEDIRAMVSRLRLRLAE
jgi:hypothetical protein